MTTPIDKQSTYVPDGSAAVDSFDLRFDRAISKTA